MKFVMTCEERRHIKQKHSFDILDVVIGIQKDVEGGKDEGGKDEG